ncbi:MAG: hypothetical protein CVU39_10795 [Chloroflexi bacterium HGW-Chloroflexi-10]|nr:MAG: hypothetical protein CVU39_10795 [Chloroflexi bacterium HGW-Chloroflexi-10]
MGHQPFEEWILEDQYKTPQQSRLLGQHISECTECANLASAWQSVEKQLLSAPTVSPAPGFTSRFQAHLAFRKIEQQQTQVIKTLIVIGSAVFLTMGSIFTWMLLTHSVGDLIVNGVSFFTGILQGYINIRAMVIQFFRNAPPYAPYLFWLIVAGWGIVLTSMWGVTIWRISRQGVFKNESNQ